MPPFVASIDPVVGTIIAGIISSGFGAIALLRTNSTRVKADEGAAIASRTQTLVDGLDKAVTRLDAQVAAKDAVIDDLKEDIEKCHNERDANRLRADLSEARADELERVVAKQQKRIDHQQEQIDKLGESVGKLQTPGPDEGEKS
jgi:uncharacterized coiled-coil protein SlyX